MILSSIRAAEDAILIHDGVFGTQKPVVHLGVMEETVLLSQSYIFLMGWLRVFKVILLHSEILLRGPRLSVFLFICIGNCDGGEVDGLFVLPGRLLFSWQLDSAYLVDSGLVYAADGLNMYLLLA